MANSSAPLPMPLAPPDSASMLSQRAKRALPLILLLAALMLAPVIVRHHAETYGPLTAAAARHSMTPFRVAQLDGQPWNLADHRGHIVVINFWATWCAPCRRELPGLAALAHANPPGKLAILGISLDHATAQSVHDFATEYQLPYPVALADSAWQLDQIPTGIPASILLDRDGRVAKTYPGPATQAELQSDIDALLREPRSPQISPAP